MLAAGPEGVVRMVEVVFEVGHETEDATGGIAQTGDAGDTSVGVGRIPVVSAVGVDVTDGDPARRFKPGQHGVIGCHDLSFGMIHRRFEISSGLEEDATVGTDLQSHPSSLEPC